MFYFVIFFTATSSIAKEILPSKYDLNASNLNFQGTSRKFKYEITASTLSNNATQTFDLTDIEGIFDDQKQKIRIYSDKGQFDQKDEILTLNQKVRVIKEGYILTSDYARMELNTGKLYLEHNVLLKLEQGDFKADTCTVFNDFKDAKCLHNIQAHIISKAKDDDLLITSKALDIKDEGKIFKFIDSVKGVSQKYVLNTNNLNLQIASNQGQQQIDKAFITSPFKIINKDNPDEFMTGYSADYDGNTRLLCAKKHVKIQQNNNLIITDVFKVQIK
ncbi:LPS export ABC transporter periplasmic protein LptC [Candidatus Phycorickettsia trachydisci]|uniref:LPS export ABC transporter periplasmic protein LptC n=1 Tax=Candidatus Phycorickettsia trachydisci TaxID=2115978 RepID=UPI00131A4D76|nr:LPS export ABC transporter periplasmic protein LptC [Candidatus Phycorickettsia trachydisci]